LYILSFVLFTHCVYGLLHCALLLVITTPNQRFFLLNLGTSSLFSTQLDRFEVDVVEKPFSMLLGEGSYFIPNHLMSFSLLFKNTNLTYTEL